MAFEPWIASFPFIAPDLRGGELVFAPDAGEGGLDLFLEAGDQFAVGGDQRLLGFDLGDDGLLRGEGWEGICFNFG